LTGVEQQWNGQWRWPASWPVDLGCLTDGDCGSAVADGGSRPGRIPMCGFAAPSELRDTSPDQQRGGRRRWVGHQRLG
jgi:hypothetical protein